VSAILQNVRIMSMNTGFTWDTQNQEFDKKMALETWQQAEQYLKDKAINLVVLMIVPIYAKVSFDSIIS
jgi:ATP:corrinoid adenosyltransferase